jgi:hypothetical protein
MSGGTAIFAARLFPLAQSTLAEVAPHQHGPLLDALDAFLSAPGPSAFLAAWRTLLHARKARKVRVFLRRRDATELPEALALLATVPQMPARIPQELSALEADGHAAARIRALAALMGAHSELKARVDAAAQRRAAQMEAMKAAALKPTKGKSRPPRAASR